MHVRNTQKRAKRKSSVEQYWDYKSRQTLRASLSTANLIVSGGIFLFLEGRPGRFRFLRSFGEHSESCLNARRHAGSLSSCLPCRSLNGASLVYCFVQGSLPSALLACGRRSTTACSQLQKGSQKQTNGKKNALLKNNEKKGKTARRQVIEGSGSSWQSDTLVGAYGARWAREKYQSLSYRCV